MTDDGVTCISCDRSIAAGDKCDIHFGDVEYCVPEQHINGLCFECVEGRFTEMDACTPCGDGSRRCVNGTVALLCDDDRRLDSGKCAGVDNEDALAFVNNHVMKCTDAHFASGDTCGDCSDSCASCNNKSSCSACTNGTSLGSDGTCVAIDSATAQTHDGALGCATSFVVTNGVCEGCSSRFSSVCQSCSACDGEKCLRCDDDVVFEEGTWRHSQNCADADGTVCRECVSGTIRFNATDCVLPGDCMLYENGRCVQCKEPLVVLADGTCGESEDCTMHTGGWCLRCADGMVPNRDSACMRLIHPGLTSSVRCNVHNVCVQCDLLHGMRH